jgi:hypothetical protein
MISLKKNGLSTESGKALATTTILFYKKEDKKTGKPRVKNKNLVVSESGFAHADQVRFGPCRLRLCFNPPCPPSPQASPPHAAM